MKGNFTVLATFTDGSTGVFNIGGAFPASGGDWQDLILSLTEDVAKNSGSVSGIFSIQILPVMHAGEIKMYIPGDETDVQETE